MNDNVDGPSMIIRFQADINMNQIIVRAASRREPALDFQTAETAGLAGLPDPEVLAHAAEDGRILMTHDLQTMPRHFAAFTATRQSTGLLLIPRRLPIASAVDDLLLISSTMEAKSGRISGGIFPCKATTTRRERVKFTNWETFCYSCNCGWNSEIEIF